MQAVRDHAEADGQHARAATPSPSRVGRVTRDWAERPGQRARATITSTPSTAVSRDREREVEQVGGDEREPREQQRALEARDPLAEAAAARAAGRAAGHGEER